MDVTIIISDLWVLYQFYVCRCVHFIVPSKFISEYLIVTMYILKLKFSIKCWNILWDACVVYWNLDAVKIIIMIILYINGNRSTCTYML